MLFIKELKRRIVIRVAIAYAIVGWLLVEVASVVLPALLLPDWTLRILVFFVIPGFPLALIFAWAFELTPEGLKIDGGIVDNELAASDPKSLAKGSPWMRIPRVDM